MVSIFVFIGIVLIIRHISISPIYIRENMNCAEIIKKHLKDNEFDGLYNPDIDCACALSDEGLFPCSDPQINDCSAGYVQADPKEFDYIIGACKPRPCPMCEKPRDIEVNGAWKTCHHCGDVLPF